MRNIKLTLEYDGTDFCGWQVQRTTFSGQRSEKNRTIQEELEKALSKILNEKIKVIGSGRTDSGVHALGQVANFKTKSKLSLADIKRALNSILPGDIVLKKVEEVSLDFHARFAARSKIYRYTILNSPTPSVISRNFYFFYPHRLNLSAMRKASNLLLGKKDFKSFQASDKKKRQSQRNIKNISLKKYADFIYFDLEADGFLYKMVRNILGTLIEVGRGKIRPNQVKEILLKKNRKLAGPTAPAKGLTLMEVKYD